VTGPAPISREQVIAVIAETANRPPELVGEQIDSMGVAWLIDVAQRRWGIALDLSDELLEKMTTVTGAVEVLSAPARVRAVDG
jgi:hypothetical protein